MEDNELIDGLKNNRREAFRHLVERYQDLVVSTCYNFIKNPNDAHDTAQEVFIEVYRSIHKFRQDAAISTWLYRIAVNKSLNFLRKHKKDHRFVPSEQAFQAEKAPVNLSEPDFTQTYEKEAEFACRAKLLHQAIEKLTHNQKTAFTLHKFNNLPYKEIAEVMNLSLTAIESLIHRAKKKLQKQLIAIIEKQHE